MRPAVATVLSPRMWEPDLVGHARRTAAVRIVGRAYEPEDLLRMGSLEAVVVGAETSWLTAALIRSWRSRGWRVLGLHPANDTPGRRVLEQGGADLVAPDSTHPEQLLRTLSSWAAEPLGHREGGRITTVTGARGAPGRTTVAVALARAGRTPTLLLDADPLPNIGPALGLGPGPELADLIDGLRNDSGFIGLAHPGDGLAVLCPESGEHPLAGALVCELAMSMGTEFATVILETGPPGPHLSRMLRVSEQAVLVVDGTPQGLIRAARLLDDWPVDAPRVILNRIRGDTEVLLRSARSALGLEPEALIPRFGGDPVDGSIPFVAHLVR